jgi:tetratricopeptide (TPR) repeat protein
VDTEAAEASFRRAIAIAPGHTLAGYNLALVLRRADRLADAVAELRRVVDADPRAEAHYLLGVTYWHAGEGDRARRALADALALAPDHADAHHTLGAILRAQGDWTGAARALRRALDLRPDLWGAHHTLGQVLQRVGDEPAASHHLAEAERLRRLGQREREAAVWTAVGIAKLDAGDALDAVDAFRQATTALETWAPAHYQLGRAFAELGEHDAARSAFDRARQLNPSLVPPSASEP